MKSSGLPVRLLLTRTTATALVQFPYSLGSVPFTCVFEISSNSTSRLLQEFGNVPVWQDGIGMQSVIAADGNWMRHCCALQQYTITAF